MYNFEKLKYTYLHRKAFLMVCDLLLSGDDLIEMRKRAKYHDIDKMVLYTIMDKESAHWYHIKNSRHHKNDIEKTYYDYLEMIIDCECAALTKPDKPLNAYDSVNIYYIEYKEELLKIMHKLKIDYSYTLKNSSLKKYFDNYYVSELDIITEITDYINEKQIPYIA